MNISGSKAPKPTSSELLAAIYKKDELSRVNANIAESKVVER